jgi:DNA-3-methyladenine glycosylase I
VVDDRGLYERLCLEAFQSGLAWLTILRKRDAFRSAFAGFEVAAVARFGEEDVARLLANAGIVRNRAKVEAAIANARAALALAAAPRARARTSRRERRSRGPWRAISRPAASASSERRRRTP